MLLFLGNFVLYVSSWTFFFCCHIWNVVNIFNIEYIQTCNIILLYCSESSKIFHIRCSLAIIPWMMELESFFYFFFNSRSFVFASCCHHLTSMVSVERRHSCSLISWLYRLLLWLFLWTLLMFCASGVCQQQFCWCDMWNSFLKSNLVCETI